MDTNNYKVQNPILVTICCTAYNQEKYIRQCLDGFVMQKTQFCFEAVVHDDASTDNTAATYKGLSNSRLPHTLQYIYHAYFHA